MTSEDTKISEFNQYQKSDKAPFMIYADLECIEKIDECKNNPKNLSTTKVGKYIPSGFSMSTISPLIYLFIFNMDDIHRNIEEYNPNKKRKILIALDDMIADMLSNKKLHSIVTELSIRGQKLNMILLHNLILLCQKY